MLRKPVSNCIALSEKVAECKIDLTRRHMMQLNIYGKISSAVLLFFYLFISLLQFRGDLIRKANYAKSHDICAFCSHLIWKGFSL